MLDLQTYNVPKKVEYIILIIKFLKYRQFIDMCNNIQKGFRKIIQKTNIG